jgi:hypothetical protein
VCNKDLSTEKHPASLYGKKSDKEGLLKCLQDFVEDNTIHEDDGLSKFICRSCVTKITYYLKRKTELKSLFLSTESANRDSLGKEERLKRGRKNESIPSLQESPSPLQELKKAKHLTPRSRKNITLAPKFGTPPPARVSLTTRFQVPSVGNSQPRLFPREADNIEEQSNLHTQKRILPNFLNNKKRCDSSLEKGVDLLKSVGLHKQDEVYVNIIILIYVILKTVSYIITIQCRLQLSIL